MRSRSRARCVLPAEAGSWTFHDVLHLNRKNETRDMNDLRSPSVFLYCADRTATSGAIQGHASFGTTNLLYSRDLTKPGIASSVQSISVTAREGSRDVALRLVRAPGSDVTVALTPSHAGVSVSPSAVTFTSGERYGRVVGWPGRERGCGCFGGAGEGAVMPWPRGILTEMGDRKA